LFACRAPLRTLCVATQCRPDVIARAPPLSERSYRVASEESQIAQFDGDLLMPDVRHLMAECSRVETPSAYCGARLSGESKNLGEGIKIRTKATYCPSKGNWLPQSPFFNLSKKARPKKYQTYLCPDLARHHNASLGRRHKPKLWKGAFKGARKDRRPATRLQSGGGAMRFLTAERPPLEETANDRRRYPPTERSGCALARSEGKHTRGANDPCRDDRCVHGMATRQARSSISRANVALTPRRPTRLTEYLTDLSHRPCTHWHARRETSRSDTRDTVHSLLAEMPSETIYADPRRLKSHGAARANGSTCRLQNSASAKSSCGRDGAKRARWTTPPLWRRR
jgi:hypothetical protein